MLKKLLCWLDFHWFEKEPSVKTFIKATGVEMAFWSEGIQKGVKKCIRSGCSVEKKVYRMGWLGLGGGESGRWKKLSSKKEAYIDSLPTL